MFKDRLLAKSVENLGGYLRGVNIPQIVRNQLVWHSGHDVCSSAVHPGFASQLEFNGRPWLMIHITRETVAHGVPG